MMKIREDIIYELQGSCKSLLEVLEFHECEHLELDSDFLAELDSRIFCCELCNWWMEISEMAEDAQDRWICEECASDDI